MLKAEIGRLRDEIRSIEGALSGRPPQPRLAVADPDGSLRPAYPRRRMVREALHGTRYPALVLAAAVLWHLGRPLAVHAKAGAAASKATTVAAGAAVGALTVTTVASWAVYSAPSHPPAPLQSPARASSRIAAAPLPGPAVRRRTGARPARRHPRPARPPGRPRQRRKAMITRHPFATAPAAAFPARPADSPAASLTPPPATTAPLPTATPSVTPTVTPSPSPDPDPDPTATATPSATPSRAVTSPAPSGPATTTAVPVPRRAAGITGRLRAMARSTATAAAAVLP